MAGKINLKSAGLVILMYAIWAAFGAVMMYYFVPTFGG
jgi:hypothetical protein